MASLSKERIKVLEMVENGQITAEEAAAMLRAMEGGSRDAVTAAQETGNGRFLRINVTDITSGADKVNITLPLRLVSVGLRMASRFAPQKDLDLEGVEELIASGIQGKIVEIVDAEDNEQVAIYVE